ncbi:MAG TPA: hypothetical protein VJ810_10640 [Blastocatellia bacterium]|nr:hypothetical protein [Blastocatellia bacterium]
MPSSATGLLVALVVSLGWSLARDSLSRRNRFKIAVKYFLATRLVIVWKAPASIHQAITPILILTSFEAVSLPQAVDFEAVTAARLGDATGVAGFDR